MRILLAGASGLIGQALAARLKADGHELTELVRPGGGRIVGATAVEWDPIAGRFDPAVVAGHDAVFCLSGHNLMDGRWTKQIKQLILESRVKPVSLLANAIAALAAKQPEQAPKLFFSASAVGYYGHTPMGEPKDESAPPGKGYLADVCVQWESAAQPALAVPGVRTVIMRTGFVVAMHGGALDMTVKAFQRGLGGVLGSGKQAVSWIALSDLLDALVYTMSQKELSGPVNYVSPNAVDNREFTKILAAELHKPAVLPIPAFAAKAKFGELAEELLLNGQHVVPAKLDEAWFKWKHPDFASAIRAALHE